MRLIQLIGQALRPIRSDESKMLEAQPETTSSEQIQVKSPSFEDGQPIPIECTADGASKFCGVKWSNIPPNTESILIVCEDPDIPKDKPFIHLMAYNLAPDMNELPPEAFDEKGKLQPQFSENGVAVGGNSMGQPQWMGPAPPPGHGVHHYYFQVFALDKRLIFEHPIKMPELKEAIDGHVLAHGEIVGTYERT